MIRGVALVAGTAEGPVAVVGTPLSFWGGYEAATGRVMDRHHPDHNRLLGGSVMLMERARGSSSGSSVLAEAIRRGTAPAAIVMRTRDAIIVTGAMVAAELYGRVCPVILIEAETDWRTLTEARAVAIAADGGLTVRR